MLNRMLLTTVEIALIITVSIAVLLFLYVVFGGAVKSSVEKIKQLKPRKHKEEEIKEVETQEEVAQEKAPEQKKSENNPYEAILEKVHQNRERYYSESEIQEEIASKTTQPSDENSSDVELPFDKDVDFAEIIRNKMKEDGVNPEDFEDFEDVDLDDIDFNADNFDFGYQEEDEVDDIEFLKNEMRRKRMLKRTGLISDEINRCSDRIKAMLVLDILNKRLF